MSISKTFAALVVFAMALFGVTIAESNTANAGTGAVFVNRADVRHWVADGERGLWIQTGSLKWFYARFTSLCHGLNSTSSLVFATRASDHIDLTSSIVVPGRGRCALQILAPSGGPPKNRNADVMPEPQVQ